ncbi:MULTISPECIES: TY-Chap domain-containing protein [unclassified Knoellia]|uniref:TY-Chap domain-containing protein n=1 Tax=Knoellia altitudinis TaxID=3404795 RepID=UPI00360CF165
MTYAVELPADGPADWTEWSAALALRIRGLAEGEDVVVSLPSLARPHLVRKSRFLGIIPAVHEDTWPWARVRRDDDHAVAELVGSESFGGELLLSDAEEAQVDALGWRRPSHDEIEARVWSRWFPDDVAVSGYLPASDAAAAAALVTRTLRELFVTDV